MGGGKLNKAFTLIEIISVIVIIGIIALITVPITIRVIKEARKRSFLITAEGIVKAATISAAEYVDDYDSYFLKKDTVTFKFSKAEGKEGESVEEVNGKKIKLAFSGKNPVGGEVILHKNGDVEVVNLTDGTYYVNKDVDTELVLTEDSTILTRDELQEALEKIQQDVKDLQDENKALKEVNTGLSEKDKELEGKIVETSFAQMRVKGVIDAPYGLDLEKQTVITSYTVPIQVGEYVADISKGRIYIPKGTTYIETGGLICGYNYGGSRLMIDAVDGSTSTYRSLLIHQPSGNLYWVAALPTEVTQLDPTKDYYVYLAVFGYNNKTFRLNYEFGDRTTIYVKKLQ